jgi:tetraacyldisaccharide 4'-kinase
MLQSIQHLWDRAGQALRKAGEFLVDIVYERNTSHTCLCQVICGLLLASSWVFGLVVRCRHFLYQKGILKSQPLGCLVIVVGNLTVGGTGKTPVVEIFAKLLSERGRKVAILSRGYKSKADPLYVQLYRWLTHAQTPPPKVVSDGQSLFLDSEQAGDEPYMLARNLPGVIVLVDKDRVKAGQYAIEQFGADTLILDDGFQYLPLQSKIQLLLIDTLNPFGNGHLLPRGILREPIAEIRRASYVFLTKSQGPTSPLEAVVRRYKPEAEIITCTHRGRYLQPLDASPMVQLDALRDQPIAVLSGIASPQSFEDFLHHQGARLVYKERFLDHHRFSAFELDQFFAHARQAQAKWVVTTEKDSVRIPQAYTRILPVYYLRMQIDILSGHEDFQHAIDRICFPGQSSKAGPSVT